MDFCWWQDHAAGKGVAPSRQHYGMAHRHVSEREQKSCKTLSDTFVPIIPLEEGLAMFSGSELKWLSLMTASLCCPTVVTWANCPTVIQCGWSLLPLNTTEATTLWARLTGSAGLIQPAGCRLPAPVLESLPRVCPCSLWISFSPSQPSRVKSVQKPKAAVTNCSLFWCFIWERLNLGFLEQFLFRWFHTVEWIWQPIITCSVKGITGLYVCETNSSCGHCLCALRVGSLIPLSKWSGLPHTPHCCVH